LSKSSAPRTTASAVVYGAGRRGTKTEAGGRQKGTRRLEARTHVMYSAAVPASRPSMGFTARVIPRFDGVEIPLECASILWQR
jgi:hypothetical protein